MREISPALFSALTLRRKEWMLQAEQCDCACAETSLVSMGRASAPQEPLRCTDVFIQSLPAGHVLLANPRAVPGAAVLNSAAWQVWERYRVPGPGQLPAESFGRDRNLAPLLDQMVAHGLLEPVGEMPASLLQPGAPRVLGAWLHLTNACNLRCGYCYLASSSDSMSESTGRAAIDALVRSALQGGFKQIKIKFAGGEPSLRLDLVYALHDYACRTAASAGLELDSIILTNGTLLDDADIAELAARSIRIMVSLDGLGSDHDGQRRRADGAGSFAEVSRTLDRLAARSLKPFISITVTGRSAPGLPALVSYLLDRELPFNFNLYRDNRFATASGLALTMHQVIAALEQALDVIEAKSPAYSPLGSLLDRCVMDRPHERTCGVGESYLVFDPHGRVAKCHMLMDQPITDVFSDDPLGNIKQDQHGLQNLSVDEKDGCRDCKWKYWCAGGCPLVTYRATGRYDTRSPYCRIYQTIIPQMLRLEGLRLMKLAGLPI